MQQAMADLKSNLEQQMDELELLQSVFSAPGEFQIEDQATFDQASAFLRDLTPATPGRLSCSLHIPIGAHQPEGPPEASGGDGSTSQHILNISIRLPHSYPETLPEAYISSNDLSRTGQDDLNADLQDYMSCSVPQGEVCLLAVTEWIRDNAARYFPTRTVLESSPAADLDAQETDSHFCRMWLYMHHIYSKTKRRDILSLSSELDLTGFMLPGKPGVVCVEGDVRNTKQFYNILRRWNWKSISCRKKEVVPDRDISVQRKITGFQELGLDTHGPRQNHMDMGQFLDYLREHGLEYMFKTLFGVEGHTGSHGTEETKRIS